MICLDTNIFIGAINGRHPRLAARLDAEIGLGRRIVLPAIVMFELHYGIAKSKWRERSISLLEEFLKAGIAILPFESDDALEAGRIRAWLDLSGTPIGPYDVLIAAQVRHRNAKLITNNTREFNKRVPNLLLEDWSI